MQARPSQTEFVALVAMLFQEHGRGVFHFTQAHRGHFKHAEFIGGAKAIL